MNCARAFSRLAVYFARYERIRIRKAAHRGNFHCRVLSRSLLRLLAGNNIYRGSALALSQFPEPANLSSALRTNLSRGRNWNFTSGQLGQNPRRYDFPADAGIPVVALQAGSQLGNGRSIHSDQRCHRLLFREFVVAWTVGFKLGVT